MADQDSNQKKENEVNEDSNSQNKKHQKEEEFNETSKAMNNIEDEPSNSQQDFKDDSNEYLLFLILILLFVGNQKTFNEYFRLLNEQSREIKNVLNAFESTAEGLQNVILEPQKVLNKNK